MNLSRQKSNANAVPVGKSCPINKSGIKGVGQKNDEDPFKEYVSERKKQRALDKMVSSANARGEAEEAMVNFLVSELCLTMSAIMGHTHKYKLLIGGLVGPDLAMFDEFLTAILTPGQRILLSKNLFNKAVSEIERKMASEGEDNLLPKELAACVDGIKTACGKFNSLTKKSPILPACRQAGL